MYRVGVIREFIAHHHLIGGDFGPECEEHSHHYRLEVVLEAAELDAHGFVFDISVLETRVEELLGRLRDTNLNALEELREVNPSVEHVARVCAHAIAPVCEGSNVQRVVARVWEHEKAWASCEVQLS